MANELMTNEENYAFDVAGYLHIPVTTAGLQRLNWDKLSLSLLTRTRLFA